MSKRKITIASLGIITISVLWLATIVVADGSWTASEMVAIHVVMDNRTSSEIGPFTLADGQGAAPVYFDAIAPLSKGDAYFVKSESWGENGIVMIDEDGRQYLVVPYFENGQKGRVDIRIDCASPIGFAGVERTLVSWYFSFEWHPWGFDECFTVVN